MEANITHKIKTLDESKILALLEFITITPINTQKIFTKGSQLIISPPADFTDSNKNVIVKNINILNNFLVTFRTSEAINTVNNRTS
jgi:hypothetical protein